MKQYMCVKWKSDCALNGQIFKNMKLLNNGPTVEVKKKF